MPSTSTSSAAPPSSGVKPDAAATPGISDRLVQLIDHCTAAQATADSMGDKFLSYMLGMVIQQARHNMRAHSLRS